MKKMQFAAALMAGLLTAALVLGVGLLTWLAVRIATRPLSRMAAAARALGEDPALASGIFVATLNDIIGFSIFLGMGTLMLNTFGL